MIFLYYVSTCRNSRHPGNQDHHAARESQQRIQESARMAAPKDNLFRQKSEQYATGKTEEMGTKVGCFSLGAENGQQCHSCSDRQSPAFLKMVSVTHHAYCCQNADRTEHGSGCADR